MKKPTEFAMLVSIMLFAAAKFGVLLSARQRIG